MSSPSPANYVAEILGAGGFDFGGFGAEVDGGGGLADEGLQDLLDSALCVEVGAAGQAEGDQFSYFEELWGLAQGGASSTSNA